MIPQPESGVALARYVVQWDALLPGGGSSGGTTARYGPRFEAWLTDAAALGLQPVLGLTSYDGVYPSSPTAYAAGLHALLGRAAALGHPIAFLEPWNEPNGQGNVSPATAAGYANAAAPSCTAGCTLIAGDFEDRADSAAYARAYARALTFAPGDWGVHPYVSVATRDLAPVLALKRALPRAGAGQRLWVTEVAALRCRRGYVAGDGRQAKDAAFLVNRLAPDPELAPAHVLYYGLLAGDRRPAPCSRDGGEDGELFRPDGTPRPAAAIVFPRLVADGPAAAFGPGPA